MDYTAAVKGKLRIWAKNPQVVSMPQIANLPHFGKKSFRTYSEMNEWKKTLLRELARRGGAKWTSASNG